MILPETSRTCKDPAESNKAALLKGICHAHCILLGHKPIIDVNPRRSVDMQEALRREKKARRTLG